MKTIAVIVAKTRAGLLAVADASNMNIISGTDREFDELGLFKDPIITGNAAINIGEPGWVCLARRD
jgi:hypothetical protein